MGYLAGWRASKIYRLCDECYENCLSGSTAARIIMGWTN